jgi:hypothetical protein
LIPHLTLPGWSGRWRPAYRIWCAIVWKCRASAFGPKAPETPSICEASATDWLL